jgi:Tol biopolymer transport system component
LTTKQMEPDVEPPREQKERQRKANRNKKVGAFAAAAAIALVAVACTPETRGEDAATRASEAQTSAQESPTVAPETISGPFYLDLQTGERTPLPENLGGGYIYAASPDGARLALNTCCSAADVMTVANIDGTEARTLKPPEGLNYYGPSWSPDGTKLVYQERNGGDDGLTGDVGNLILEDLSSGRRTQLTDLDLSRAFWWYLSPSFSPDGRNVIFHLPRSKSQTTKWDVWSVPVTGGEPTLVLRNASFPMLRGEGPEGQRIAFVSPWPSDFAGPSLMTGRPFPESDIRQTLVEATGSIVFPTLSPDGNRIAYQDGDSIYVVDVSTGESSEVAGGATPGWLDKDTLIVTPE